MSIKLSYILAVPVKSTTLPTRSFCLCFEHHAVYTLSALQAEINQWGFKYYSREGQEPLLYLTVLLLSCQFAAALKLLWVHDSTKAYRVDGVHLTAALVLMEVGAVGRYLGAVCCSYLMHAKYSPIRLCEVLARHA